MYSRVAVKEPDWNWRTVDFSAELLFPTRGVRELAGAKFRITSISEGGASVHVGGMRNIPDFFYLQFGGEDSQTTGCQVVERTADTIHCEFLREKTPTEIERILLEQEMAAIFDTLEKRREEQKKQKEQMVQEILRIL